MWENLFVVVIQITTKKITKKFNPFKLQLKTTKNFNAFKLQL
jgi:hypothetical protein